ncbi:hypothetical protein KRP22_004624 [Phytophthora ramorum]|uniref:uncharacterized protein n=1 Tax=Phytophthora ramorum TaxID=164328 RepID=UPI0030B38886|nr:hypothetical protein KRP23_10813 [Phytophthora ramorum]KAH7499638.1 hypothetical protein KRP22_10255 [Phytophthora ramorum]
MDNVKKRPSAPTEPIAKRSRVSTTKSKNVIQDTRNIVGKKRRQAAVHEAAPVTTDLPPLPFSSTKSALWVKREETSKNLQKNTTNKLKTKVETKKNHWLHQVGDLGGRRCEFCKKLVNICVLMHCAVCRRAYHAKCLVHAFKPYVDENTPILDQIERLRHENRGNIFRCASCKAAFVDFYESGGYLWECDCPTCSQPEKLALYRQRKLLQMINDVELKKQRKHEQKHQVPRKNDTGNPPVTIASRLDSDSRSRRTQGSSTTHDDQVINTRAARRSTLRSRRVSPQSNELMMESGAATTKAVDVAGSGSKSEVAGVEKETTADAGGAVDDGDITAQEQQIIPQDVVVVDEQRSSPPQENDEPCQQTKGESGAEPEPSNTDMMAGLSEPKQLTESDETVMQQQEQPNPEPLDHQDAPVAQSTTPQKQEPAPKAPHELVGASEQPALSGDELVSAVRVQRDDKTNRWRFPIMCSRTSSLRESGVMKSGTCIWSPKKMAITQCDCCSKQLNYAEFVHHTDSRLVKNVKDASEDPMPHLFVEHRDMTQHTPLEKFLPALRSWAAHQRLNNTPAKSRRSHSMRQEALTTATTSSEASTKAIPDFLSRLRTLALFKRPKHRSDKTSTAVRLSDPANFDFLAQVVCLSPKYVMRMVDGSLVDRAAFSEIPEPGHLFPRKSGWLAFNHLPLTARQITCMCCEKRFGFDEFAGHAGIVPSELRQRSRQLLYVVERQDEYVLVPFNTFVRDLDTAARADALGLLLDELHLPPACHRPI